MKQNSIHKTGQTKFYFWAFLLLLVIIVFLLNAIMGVLHERYPISVDLTKDGLYEISPESKAFIADLQNPVEIHVLAKENDFVGDSTYMAQANEIIRQYEKYGKNISLNYVNYVADPTFSSQYPDVIMSHGDILISSNGKHRVITTKELFNYTYDSNGRSAIASSKADQVLASAILNVISDDPTLVTILTGSGEYTMSSFATLLKNNNFEVVTANLITEDLDPECKFAVLIAPHTDLSQDVIKKLDEFLYNNGNYGKTLLYTADAEQKPLPNLEAFLREWGIQIEDGAVFETDEKRVYNYHPFYAAADYAEEEYRDMLRDRNSPMLMPISRPLETLYEYRNNNSVKVLLEFGKTAAVRPSDAPESFTQKDASVRGPFPALVLASYAIKDKSTGKVEKQSNIIVSGSSGMLDGYSIENDSLSNSEYLLNLFNTLSEKKDSVKIQSKTITGRELNISTSQANWLGLVFALLIPLAIFAVGIAVWLYRRHK
ncbi:Gldg family protein [Sinanaerobacter chloroacetimidivorans]|jgi:ABC-2 type transport system permease protein|uniref:Gldg family protein n=1 Tax=Sinanaerobacter chloroacetimidivorans TaxID=2818044 RepID=A0A8J7W0X3_9FIRM|nr:Gldg family protein [Sinanaerobacter chloroacetimidivorans]MBR0598371.1 Gldg family protein [Sinanaerobacter chloroacetimidivorans]